MRTVTTSLAIALAAVTPAAAAQAREPVARAAAAAAAHHVAAQSAAGIETLTKGAAHIDRSRTGVGSYVRFGKFRMGVSYAIFGTNTVNGELRTLWCVGYVEVMRARSGGLRVAPGPLFCPAS